MAGYTGNGSAPGSGLNQTGPKQGTAAYKAALAADKAATAAGHAQRQANILKSYQTQRDAAAAVMFSDNDALQAAKKGSSYFKITSANQTGHQIVCSYSPGAGGRIPISGEPIAIVGIDAHYSFTTWSDGVYYVGVGTVHTTNKTFTIQVDSSANVSYPSMAITAYCGVGYNALASIVAATHAQFTSSNTWNSWVQKVNAATLAANKSTALVPGSGGGGSGGGGGAGGGAGVVDITPDNSPPQRNVPSLTSAYFQTTNKSLFTAGGSPASAAAITTAQDLWAGATNGAHKGMFQTYSYWKLENAITKGSKYKDPNLPTWFDNSYQKSKYAFQFLYNPGEVSMDWGGTPTVDPGLLMSGKDATPYIVPSQSASNISFNLIINRMPDVGLINSLSPNTADPLVGINAAARESVAYYGQTVSVDDLTQIYELGTMYDIEYLLSTLVGFRMYSDLRSRYTADIGFLMGLPVELHLGKQLRYLGTISYFNVTHTIFGENMVPLFTNIQIGFSRRIEPVNGNKHGVNGSLTPSTSLSVSPTTSTGHNASGSQISRTTLIAQ